MDRGYVSFNLFRRIIDIGPSFVGRVRENAAFEVLENYPLSEQAVQAKIVRDVRVRFTGWKASAPLDDQPMRIVQIKCKPRPTTGRRPGDPGPTQGETLLVATNVLDASSEVIARFYQHRGAIETFFRFFKHVLGYVAKNRAGSRSND